MEILNLATNQLNQNGYSKNTLTKGKIGALYTFPTLHTPDDCLPCDGYSLNILDYTDLYNVLGKQFNKSDDEFGTFRIPDYNISKRFLQPGNNVGSVVFAGLPQHTHSGTTSSNGAHTHTAQSAGAHKHDIGFDNYAGSRYGITTLTGNYKQAGWGGAATNANSAYTSSTGAHTHTTTSDGAHTHTMTTGNASDSIYGGSTTVQPPSQIVHICIKYK